MSSVSYDTTFLASPGLQGQHPRRSAQKGAPGSLSLDSSSPVITSLQKSGTFHSPTPRSSGLYDPLKDFKPKRSHTNTDCLENLTADPDPRVAAILETYDKTAAGDVNRLDERFNEQDVLPVPPVTLGHSTIAPASGRMEVDQPVDAEHHHASDSGIGTSINTNASESRSAASDSAVTKSYSSTQTVDGRRPLSSHAIEQIKTHVLAPILRESALKEFHSLVKDVPRRIDSKLISNLRDLEKTFVFLAPDLSATSDSYLRFCETSIRCIHATVDFLSEPDQRRPTDRPYSNYYFLDLVEQIRKYAAVLAATREKLAAGEELEDMDYSLDEKISVRGGISYDGRPLELFREKNGKAMSLAEDADILTNNTKRPLSPIMDDEGVRRSMGRRRKSDRAGDVIHSCRDCSKKFNRPCDLTKHEKTHSRPWKCTEDKCRYAAEGWPTEKERDRHVNDKHCANPKMYKCEFLPCTYSSKRSSNCKQHMEKAHGYIYPRKKGKQATSPNNSGGPSVTYMTNLSPESTSPITIETPVSVPTSSFSGGPSPEAPLFQELNTDGITFGSGIAPMQSTPLSIADFRDEMESVSTNVVGLYANNDHGINPMGVDTFDMAGLGDIPNGLNIPMQQPTPAQSGAQVSISDFSHIEPFLDVLNSSAEGQVAIPGFSPGAEPNLVFSLPGNVQLDDPSSVNNSSGAVTRDFTLYPSVPLSGDVATTDFFQPLHVYTGHADSTCFATADDAFSDDQLYSAR